MVEMRLRDRMNKSLLRSLEAKQSWVSPALIIAVALLAGLSISLERPPHVVSAEASPTEFSAERAQRHLSAIARAPHPIGSERAQAVRDYIMGELKAAGLEPQSQQLTGVNTGWGPPFP